MVSRQTQTEADLKRIYEQIARDLLRVVSELYAKYEKDGQLNYVEMAKFNRLNNLEKDIIEQINTLSKESRNSIMTMLQQNYFYAFEYMAYGIETAAGARLAFSAVPLEKVMAAINNPITGLTLSETLEARRGQVIMGVKRELIQGMVRGDTYKTMTQRVQEVFQGDFRKAVRVVRTEGHRIHEAAQTDAVERAHAQGVIMKKKWNSLHDSKVRHTGKADHRKLDGQLVPVDEEFDLGRGKKGKLPGNTGLKEHDINCRCFTTYQIVRVEKKTTADLANMTFEEWRKTRLKSA